MRVRASLAWSLAAVLAGCGGGHSSSDGGGTGGGSAGTGGSAAGGAVGGVAGAGGSSGGAAGAGGDAGATGSAGTGANVDAAIDQPITIDAAEDGTSDVAADTVTDADPDSIICTPSERPALRGAPDILIVLDASGSMNNDLIDMSCSGGCGLNSKWAQMVPAINQIVAATESSVNWGLKFFADTDTRCGVGSTVAVPVQPANSSAIAAAIAGRTTANGDLANGSLTPTRTAETVAADALAALMDSNPKFILLATDGLPNCVSTAQPNNDDSPAAVAAVSAAASRGFPTFVVGIATSASGMADSTLSMMAVAGGRPRDGTPQYYPASSTNELLAALDGIVGQAGTCTLGIGQPPPGASLDAIDVRGDRTPIARDTTHVSGWDYADPAHTAISLFGPACTALRNGTVQQITIAFHCLPAG